MYISKIILTNIRSYSKQTITFNNGINVLYGNIGSGKSTILQAIEVALFGLKKGDGNHMLRKGEKEGSIEIMFENESDSITLKRIFKRTKQGITQSSGSIQMNSSLKQELSTQELNVFVFNYFQFPISFINKDKTLMYRFTYYTPQEQLKEILTIQSDRRLDILRKVFNIDTYKQLQYAYSLSSKQLSKELIVYETKLSELPDEIEKEIERLNKQINTYKSSVETLNQKEEELKQKLKKVYSNKQTLEEKRATIKEQVRTNKQLQEQLKSIDKELLENYSKVDKLQHEYKEAASKHNEIRQSLHRTVKQIETLQQTIKSSENIYQELQKIQDNIGVIEKQISKQELIESLQSQLNSYHHTIIKYKCRAQDIIVAQKKEVKLIEKRDKLSKELESLEEEKTQVSKQLMELNAQVTSMQHQVLQVTSLPSNSKEHEFDNLKLCPTCHQPIDESHIQHLQEQLTMLKERYDNSSLHKQLETLQISIQEKNEKLNLLNEELKQYEKESYKLESTNENISEYEEEQKKIQIELDNKKKDFEKNSNKWPKTNNELHQELNSLLESKKQLQDKIRLNDEYIQQLESLENQKKELEQTIHSTEKHQYEISTQIKSITEKTSDLEKKKEEITNEIKRLEKSIRVNEKIDENIKRQEEIENKLNDKCNSIIKEKSEYETSIRFTTSQMREYEEELKKKKSLTKNIEILQEQKDFLLKEMSEMCRIIEETLFIELLSDVSQALRTYFIQLIEEQDIDVYLRDDFSLIIEQNGYEVDVEQLSGGEKSALALSYRLALKEVIERHFKHTTILDFIILDEPTDGFSQTQVQKFSTILQQANFKQAFLVSHDPSLSTAGEYVYVVEKEHHTSTIELRE